MRVFAYREQRKQGKINVADEEKSTTKRAFLGIWFDCCNTYGRIYKNAQGTAYTGRCPKCLRPVTVRIGGDGTSQRFFRGS